MPLAPGSTRRRNAHPHSARATHRVPSCRGGSASAVSRGPAPSMAAMSHHLLDFADGFGGIEILRARLGAIHDGMASIQAKWIFEIIEALAGRLIPAVDYPTIGRQQRRGPQVPVAVPPIAGT